MKPQREFIVCLCLIVFAYNFSKAQDTTKTPDAIDWLVAELGSSGRSDGMVSSVHLPETASTEEIVSNAFKQQDRFNKLPTEYKIVEWRKAEFPLVRDKYTAALVQTSAGQKIVLFKFYGSEIGWWYRIYDAPKSFTLDGRGNVIWNWLDFSYARNPEWHLALVEVASISNEQDTFTNAQNSQVSDDGGKTWYNLLHVRSGMATCKVIECLDTNMPSTVTVGFERFHYVPTRDTPWTDPLIQPKVRLLGFFTQQDGKWILTYQFLDPVEELLEPHCGKRLQALFKTPLASEDALAKRKQMYDEATIRARQRATNNVDGKQN